MSNTGVVLPANAPDSVVKDAAEIDDRIKEFQERHHRRPSATPPIDPNARPDGNPPASQASGSDGSQTPTATQDETVADQAIRLGLENEALRRKTADLQRQVDIANGKFGGTIQGLKATIVDLQREMAELKASKPSLDAGAASAQSSGDGTSSAPWLVGVDSEALDKYGEEFFKQVWRTNRAEFDKLRSDIKDATRKADERVKAIEQKSHSEQFAARVEVLCPGATEINGGSDGSGPLAVGWPEFLDTPVNAGGVLTNRQEAEASVASGNAPAFAALVWRFKNSMKQAQTPQRQDVRAEVTPLSVKGKTEPQQGKRKIPESEIRAWSDKMAKAPPGSISAAEVDSKMREFADARREGRVYRDV